MEAALVLTQILGISTSRAIICLCDKTFFIIMFEKEFLISFPQITVFQTRSF